ncbi:AAA family ATPase [Pseudomonas protegens]|uniref:AAA family ATPase n=1 Tax=Pseudomonas protegens TaxID=380021 RepID=UPI0022801731|nr:AAA family ATPase [Pseudomonas protegens]MCY7263970.1 AAA family ATPase [Pseudomonas protegens]
MITKIKKLKNFGIFRDFNGETTQEFGKINLIYGWNGSGKSTLSKVFESLEKRRNLQANAEPNCEFSIVLDGNITITEKNILQSSAIVRTFNAGFIKENIDWDNSVKSILLVAKEKIDDRKNLEKLKAQQEIDLKSAEIANSEVSKFTTELQKFLTDSAKRTKSSLQIIGTEDSHYLNYNRTKLESFIASNTEAIRTPSSILQNDELAALIVAAKPVSKPQLPSIVNRLDTTKLKEAQSRLESLMKQTATSILLTRLKENPDIQSWVETGLTIHNRHKSENCEFCGAALIQARIEEINAHFSEEYRQFQSRLISAEQWLNQQFLVIAELSQEEQLYEEMRSEFTTAAARLSSYAASVNDGITRWQELLQQKISDQFRTDFTVPAIDADACEGFNLTLAKMNNTINLHNRKTEDFTNETSAIKRKIELHYAAMEVKDFGYFSKIQKRDNISKKVDALQEHINTRQKVIQELEAALSNEVLGADEFNKHLHNFLGRSDLCLRFNSKMLGYEIIRGTEQRHARDLSEGEKTAIAFVYFITKLSEGDNDIAKFIIAVDDPISSFDSNHLFHAYSYLRHHCTQALQLFVLTHNFNFFKLIRDWLDSTNTNRKNRRPPKLANCFFYVIEATTESPRNSALKNAPKSLHDYSSEYHYIFSRLYSYREQAQVNRDEAFLTANLARKILESFFSFKYPIHKGDMASLFQQGLNGCTITTSQTKEKIYRFINKYSHNAVIEIGEDSLENLVGESHNVIADIFIWMKEVDDTHYEQMVKSLNNLSAPLIEDLDKTAKAAPAAGAEPAQPDDPLKNKTA